MPKPVNRILVVTKAGDSAAEVLGAEVYGHLKEFGVDAILCEHLSPDQQQADVCREAFDLALVLGGDGTFIGVARSMLHRSIPLLGINLGRVGFLTYVNRVNWREELEPVVRNGIRSVRRMVLEYDVLRNGEIVDSGRAVNDLVISRGELARLVRMGVTCGDTRISSLRADGLIVSTPSGSTAYGVSAGGPLVHPDFMAFCLTPVCPFLNSFKPMVVPGDLECRVRIEEDCGQVGLTEDGQRVIPLCMNDEVVIRRSNTDLLIAEAGTSNYFERLRLKGFVTEA